MNKNLKDLLTQKLAANTKTHREAQQTSSVDLGKKHVKIPIDDIDPNPYQPRKAFAHNEIESLAKSIAETGLLQPIIVREVDNRYQIIAGERRWRAHKILDKHSIEAIITSAEDNDMALSALVENLVRENLSDYEIGKSLRNLENMFPTKGKLAKAVGMDRTNMYAYFSFEALPENVIAILEKNPALFSRTAAIDLKKVIHANKDNVNLSSILNNAMTLLEKNALKQGKLISYIEKQLSNTAATDAENIKNKKSNLKLNKEGKTIGTIIRNNQGLTVRINAHVLSDIIEDKIISSLRGILEYENVSELQTH